MATDDSEQNRTNTKSTSIPLGLSLLAAAVAVLVLTPVLWILIRSAEVDYDRAVSLLTSGTTVDVFVNSVALVVAVTLLSVIVGVPLAYLTVRTDLPFRRFWTVVIMLPLVVPSYLGAFAFVSAFGPNGELQSVLAPLGVKTLPSIYGFHGAVLVLTLYTYPYVYITSRASLKTFDTRLLEAAKTLNSSRWDSFRRLIAPNLVPAVGAGSLLVALYTLSDFGTPAIMHFDAFTRVIYSEYNAFGRDFAALLSLQLLSITVVILWMESRVESGASQGGTGRGSDTVELGRWKVPALCACASIAVLALVVPIVIFLDLLFRTPPGFADSLGFRWVYAFNSVSVSVAAALISVLAAVPVAYLSVQHRSRFSELVERATYVGYATPGVVVGVGLVYLGISYARPLYQTLPLLVFAYVVRFLPQAVGSTRASLLQTDPKLAEAARSLGKSPFESFVKVTLPLISPGILAGASLVFLTTMKELPATLILSPPEFNTLVTHIWSVQEQGYYGFAAVPALMLILVSGVSMMVVLSQEGYDVK